MSRPPDPFTFPVFDGDPACAETNPDAFYPEPGGQGLMDVRDAKAVCRSCEIRVPCLTWALESGEGWGVWGGMTEAERRELTGLRRRRAS